jgi:hypothetical protein
MRKWQDSESFPEENASNYVNGRFDPQAAEALRQQHRRQAAEQPWLHVEIRTPAQRHRPHPAKSPG